MRRVNVVGEVPAPVCPTGCVSIGNAAGFTGGALMIAALAAGILGVYVGYEARVEGENRRRGGAY